MADTFQELLDNLHPEGREGRLLDRIARLERECEEMDQLNAALYEVVISQTRVIASMRAEKVTSGTSH